MSAWSVSFVDIVKQKNFSGSGEDSANYEVDRHEQGWLGVHFAIQLMLERTCVSYTFKNQSTSQLFRYVSLFQFIGFCDCHRLVSNYVSETTHRVSYEMKCSSWFPTYYRSPVIRNNV